jgi:hypothetical protein
LLQLWRFGKGDACEEEHGRDFVTVGCSSTYRDQPNDESTGMATMEKWLIDVQCEGCKGLFYRSAPNVIVTDADWPRNGDVVMGYEIPNTPGKLIKFLLQGRFYDKDAQKVFFLYILLRIEKGGYGSKMVTICLCIAKTERSGFFTKYLSELRHKIRK